MEILFHCIQPRNLRKRFSSSWCSSAPSCLRWTCLVPQISEQIVAVVVLLGRTSVSTLVFFHCGLLLGRSKKCTCIKNQKKNEKFILTYSTCLPAPCFGQEILVSPYTALLTFRKILVSLTMITSLIHIFYPSVSCNWKKRMQRRSAPHVATTSAGVASSGNQEDFGEVCSSKFPFHCVWRRSWECVHLEKYLKPSWRQAKFFHRKRVQPVTVQRAGSVDGLHGQHLMLLVVEAVAHLHFFTSP